MINVLERPAATHICPRSLGAALRTEPTDHWIASASWPGTIVCSHCGSLSPAAFFAAIEAGDELAPAANSVEIGVGAGRKFFFQHLGVAEQKLFIDLHNAGHVRLRADWTVPPFFCMRGDDP